ncbi:hypothetical protein Hdeb2414_s0008g00283791 [Helianthus debilis subsp. tardiflorus]
MMQPGEVTVTLDEELQLRATTVRNRNSTRGQIHNNGGSQSGFSKSDPTITSKPVPPEPQPEKKKNNTVAAVVASPKDTSIGQNVVVWTGFKIKLK